MQYLALSKAKNKYILDYSNGNRALNWPCIT